jgi:hypothetical protein
MGSVNVHGMGHTAHTPAEKFKIFVSLLCGNQLESCHQRTQPVRQAIKGKFPLCLSTVLTVYRDMEVKLYMYRGQFLYWLGKDLLYV